MPKITNVKVPKVCCVMGCEETARYRVGYTFLASGRETTRYNIVCREHFKMITTGKAINPIFENRKALKRFRKKHPRLWGRIVHSKAIILFLKPEILKRKESGDA